MHSCMHEDVYVTHICQYSPAGGVWLYCAITELLPDLPAELTACTAMLVYTLFLSSPVKLWWVRLLPVLIDCSVPPSGV